MRAASESRRSKKVLYAFNPSRAELTATKPIALLNTSRKSHAALIAGSR
jgi:hypothetical protein